MKNQICIGLIAVGLSACAVQRTPHFDESFGYAVNSAKARQTIDPQAAAKAPDPNGLDGYAAAESMRGYRASFGAPAPTFQVISAPQGQGLVHGLGQGQGPR